MSPRIFIAAIGAAAAVVGLVFLVAVPIAVSDARGTSLRCGTAVNRDETPPRTTTSMSDAASCKQPLM